MQRGAAVGPALPHRYGPILIASYFSLLGLRYAYDWLIANGPAWLITVLKWM
jgi:hypothetical protein